MPELDRPLVHISMADKGDEPLDEAALPKLSVDQAVFFSFLIETGGDEEKAASRFEVEQGELPSLEQWVSMPEFIEGMRLYHADRKLLWRAMTLTLFGPSYRSLMKMIEDPKRAAKGIELLSRMHGILIDRVKQEDPSQVQALMKLFASAKPVLPIGTRYTIAELGEVTNVRGVRK